MRSLSRGVRGSGIRPAPGSAGMAQLSSLPRLLLLFIVSFRRSLSCPKMGRKRRPRGQEDPLNFLCSDFVINDCHLFPCHFDPLNLKYSSSGRLMQTTVERAPRPALVAVVVTTAAAVAAAGESIDRGPEIAISTTFLIFTRKFLLRLLLHLATRIPLLPHKFP